LKVSDHVLLDFVHPARYTIIKQPFERLNLLLQLGKKDKEDRKPNCFWLHD
jgi:hypothetical protein